MSYETIKVRKLTGGCGAEVLGVDLRQLGNRQWEEVQRAFAEFGVIFFRDQTLEPAEHLAFARRWGPIDINRFFPTVPGHPEIAEVRKEPAQRQNIGGGWHTDHSYDTAPAMGSILLARELPEEGGDTLFASMYGAFDALSDGLKATLRGLKAVHSSKHIFGAEARVYEDPVLKARFRNPEQVGDVVHPVVIRHPLSGREALYVNAAFTVRFDGWSVEDSRPLLDFLYRHAAKPEFTCRFRWRPGSIAFWDNRATWHYAANDYHGERRLMHRITVGGCTLAAAA
ncbi:MAG: TauD/TfdA family dioxygenase [Alphaproteobacteria bacterium]|nr:TauD/TfdA family dioxygenase [Alphaproteobacteria bacterium]